MLRPAANVRPPPDALVPLPALTLAAPPRPTVAGPGPTHSRPLFPALLDPELKHSRPLDPPAPALAAEMIAIPELADALAPLVALRTPPDATSLRPDNRLNAPPSPLVPLPTLALLSLIHI